MQKERKKRKGMQGETIHFGYLMPIKICYLIFPVLREISVLLVIGPLAQLKKLFNTRKQNKKGKIKINTNMKPEIIKQLIESDNIFITNHTMLIEEAKR